VNDDSRAPQCRCWPVCRCCSPSFAAAQEASYVGEAVCLDCHEDEVGEFLKTRHAHVLNEKNGRSPLMERGCEACHGPGSVHVKEEGTGGELVNFSDDTPAHIEAGKAVCLSCHERGARVHWKGSPHDSRDLACTSCHTIMKKVSQRNQLKHATEAELCGSCHPVRRAQMFRNAHMPLREGAMTCSSCHAVRRRDSDLISHVGQRHLLQLPRREARPLPVGARARDGELPRLPRPAWLDARTHAEAEPAAPVPAVSHREPAPHRGPAAREQVRDRARVPPVPREHPRPNHPSGHALTR
jgi:hypothetical protein